MNNCLVTAVSIIRSVGGKPHVFLSLRLDVPGQDYTWRGEECFTKDVGYVYEPIMRECSGVDARPSGVLAMKIV